MNAVSSPSSAPVPASLPRKGEEIAVQDAPSRKRKLGSLVDSEEPDASVLSTNADPARPRLTVSRAPAFIRVNENSPYFFTEQLAVNHKGFRYIPAGLADPGALVPYRTIESRPTGSVRISWEDRSPSIRVTEDGLRLQGEKGYSSGRLNVPVREGKWYLEVKILEGKGNVRLGWGRREAPLNGPVGIDGYSYGMRDKTGEKVTLSRPLSYGHSFGPGDIIGLYISLPPRRQPSGNDPYNPAHLKRERIAIEFKGQEYFESYEYAQSPEMISLMDPQKDVPQAPAPGKKPGAPKAGPSPSKQADKSANMRPLPTLSGSRIHFFVNGEDQGPAFTNLYDYLPLRLTAAMRKAREQQNRRRQRDSEARKHKENPFDDGLLGYYPTISLFQGAEVEINPGPDFAFPPPSDFDSRENTDFASWRPISERYGEHMEEQWAMDAEEEVNAEANQTPSQSPNHHAKAAELPPVPAPMPVPKIAQPSKITIDMIDPALLDPSEIPPPMIISPSPSPPPSLPAPTLAPEPIAMLAGPSRPKVPKTNGGGRSKPGNSGSAAPLTAEQEAKAAARREKRKLQERERRAKKKAEKEEAKRLEAERLAREALAHPDPNAGPHVPFGLPPHVINAANGSVDLASLVKHLAQNPGRNVEQLARALETGGPQSPAIFEQEDIAGSPMEYS